VRWLVLALLCLASPVAAQTAENPTRVYATEFRPPAEYKQWYRDVEKCTGMKGAYHRVMWAVTEHPWQTGVFWNGKPRYTYGQWTGMSDGSTGLILVTAVDWRNEFYVKHEILHDILWRNGFRAPDVDSTASDTTRIRASHPAPPYEKCAPTYIDQMRRLEWLKAGRNTTVYVP
jgi:hypothetical protein